MCQYILRTISYQYYCELFCCAPIFLNKSEIRLCYTISTLSKPLKGSVHSGFHDTNYNTQKHSLLPDKCTIRTVLRVEEYKQN